MGAYLPKPITDKESNDDENEFLKCGASSMQGWRSSQEDSHNCILNYDDKTAFFAVYDGHGGSEVAIYCSKTLPNLLKELDEYKGNDLEEALRKTFLEMDSILLKEDVIEELKVLAMAEEKNNSDMDKCDDEEEDLFELCEEGRMPLTEVLKKYKQMNFVKSESTGSPNKNLKAGGSTDIDKEEKTSNDLCSLSSKSPSNVTASSSSSNSKVDAESSNTSTTAEGDTTISSSSTALESNLPAQKSVETPNAKIAPQKSQTDSPDSSSGSNSKIDNQSEKPGSSADKISNGIAGTEERRGTDKKPIPSQDNEISTNSIPTENVSSSSGSNSEVKKVNTNADSAIGSSANSSSSSPSKRKSMPPMVVDSSDDSEEEIDKSYESGASSDECEEDENDEVEDETEYEESDEMDDLNDEDDENTAFMDNIIEEPGKDSGCTAVIALLKDKELYVANAGDSRCVVCRDGTALEMSFDHKPEDDLEHKRITKAGGRVTLDGRVNGGLNLSRAIGDHAYKMNTLLKPEEQMISAMPDIKRISLTEKDEFMILACDGIWNSLSNDEVIKFIKEKLNTGCEKMSKICEELFDFCLAPDTLGDGTGCDNMTAIIVKFKSSTTGDIQIDEVVSRKRSPDNSLSSDEAKRQKTEADCSSTKEDETES